MRITAYLSLILVILLPAYMAAQNKVTLSGKVADRNGTPIAQATIAIEGTTSGTYTDDLGRYSLQVPPGRHTFVVSFLGYRTVKQPLDIRQDKRHNFTLQESAVALNTVEVYGKTQTQKIKEGAFTVNALDVKSTVNSLNNLNNLVNRTTGIKVREEGGVGSDFDLSINGMSGNSIRYFLDGMPLDAKGSGVSLANLPVNIIDRIEIYKGVVPAVLGTDALGGAIHIITKQEKKHFLDASYSIGSFHSHRADLNAQIVEPKTGLIIRPTVGVNYSKNDYRMKNVEMRDESGDNFIIGNPKRFHDAYFSLWGQIEAGVTGKKWADEFFVSASYSKTDKELQTGSVQNKVYGMAERKSDAWNIAARYRKQHFILRNMQLSASLSRTWDHSLTVDTAYRKYYWDGGYIVTQRNEIMGKQPSMRHYKRPLTIVRTNLDYRLNDRHNLNLNYHLSRIGNDRYDETDEEFKPSNDVVTKHIIALSYNQLLFDGKMSNVFFVKDYINHPNIRQTDQPSVTGSGKVQGATTRNYIGYGAGTRYTVAEPLSVKASYEHSVRLPVARELLGNGTTIYANVALKPESSDNLNVALFGTWHPYAGHTVYYEAGAFLRNVNNYIQTTITEKEGTMQYTNVPAVHIKGLEGEVRYDWQSKLLLAANISYQDARDQQKLKSDGKPSATYNNRVPNRPWLFGSA
ncbi:TonB-dependent receptor, partial [Bacteroides heparinolyticus]